MIRPILIALMLAAMPAAAHGPEQVVMASGAPVERLLLPDIDVIDQRGTHGGIVSRFAARGPLLIAFSYTGCVTLCPVTHAILADVDERLGAPGAPALTILTVSLDPANDTPEAMAAAAEALGSSPRWFWLAASPAETRPLLAAMGVPPGPPEAHAPLFLLGDMESGQFRRIAGLPDPADLIALLAP